MADLYDQAQDAAERFLSASLSQRKPSPKATGKCLWCDEPLEKAAAQFCPGGDCQHDYEMYRRRNGGF
jgi:hypothetical protein